MAPIFRRARNVERNIFAQGKMASARVLEVVRGRPDNSASVEFLTEDGKTISTKIPYSIMQTSEIKFGDNIQVIYLPADASKARIYPSLCFDVVFDTYGG